MDQVDGEKGRKTRSGGPGRRRRIATHSLRTAIATGVGLGAGAAVATGAAQANGGEYVTGQCFSLHETAYGPSRNLGVHGSSRVFANSGEASDRCQEAGYDGGFACILQQYWSEITPSLPHITPKMCATTSWAAVQSAQSYVFPDILEEKDTVNLNTSRNHTGHYVYAFSGWGP